MKNNNMKTVEVAYSKVDKVKVGYKLPLVFIGGDLPSSLPSL